MLNRFLVGLVLVAGVFASVETVQAYTAAQREQIRAMPITTRPYRPGHIYGNTVRRLHRMRGGY